MLTDVDPALTRQVQLAIGRRDAEGLQAICADLAASGDTQVLNEWTDEVGASFLITAVRLDDAPCVQVLLEHGADVNYNNPQRSIIFHGTALHEAVKRGSVPIVGMLLRHDANPFMGNANGDTPLDLAMRAGYGVMTDMFSARALARLNLTAKCRVFAMTTTAGGKYKACRAMVTPYLAFDPGTCMYKQCKRVYIFHGGSIRPKVTITYQASEVVVTDLRIQLTVLDPDGTAIHQPEEGALLRSQMYYPLAMIPAAFLCSFCGICCVYGRNFAATSSEAHFLLQTEGRHQTEAWYRAFNQASSGGSSGMHGGYMGGYGGYGSYGGGMYRQANMEAMRNSAAQNPTSTLYFKPRRYVDMLEYDRFVHALEGPRNELLRTFNARTGRDELTTPADVPGGSASPSSAQAGDLQILPSPPKTLRQANKEAMCVVCLARPSEYGLVVSDEEPMHQCCSVYYDYQCCFGKDAFLAVGFERLLSLQTTM